MNAKEFWISKYPDAEKDWGKTGHDDRFQVRMMEEYAEYRVKILPIADVVGRSEQGQVDLINHIKKEVAKLEGTTNTTDFVFDIINLLKSIKPL